MLSSIERGEADYPLAQKSTECQTDKRQLHRRRSDRRSQLSQQRHPAILRSSKSKVEALPLSGVTHGSGEFFWKV